MEASRDLAHETHLSWNEARHAPWDDAEQQVVQLEALYNNWQTDIYHNNNVPITELSASLQHGEGQDELLSLMSGYLALIALDAGGTNPLRTYNAAQIAVMNHALGMEADQSLTDEELTDILIIQALEAANKVILDERAQTNAGELEASTDQLVLVPPLEELSLEKLPALASERAADTFSAGQRVLILSNGRLETATIVKAEAYQSSISLGSRVDLPKEELGARQRWLEKRYKELAQKPDYYKGLAPDPEALGLKVSLCPEFQIVMPNPSPGFLRLTWHEGRHSLITDMHHNYVITNEEWSMIKRSKTYREVWLRNGSNESLRQAPILAKAIETRILEGH